MRVPSPAASTTAERDVASLGIPLFYQPREAAGGHTFVRRSCPRGGG